MVAEQSRTVFWEVDAAGLFLHVSHVSEQVWGYTPWELVGRIHFYDLHPEEGRSRFREESIECFKQREKFRNLKNPIQRKDGVVIWVSTTGIPLQAADGALLGYRGSDTDITEHHLAEQALLIERQRLANVIEGTNAGIWEWNIQTGEVVMNERWASIVGYRLNEIPPHIGSWAKLAHPVDLAASNAMLLDHFNGRIPYYDMECRMRHKNGSWVWVHDRGRVTEWDAAGKPLRMAGTHTDITERKGAQLELEAGREHLQHAIEASELAQERLWLHMQGTPLAYVELDMQEKMSYWNPAAEALFGYTREDVLGQPVEKILNLNDNSSPFPMFLRSMSKTIATRVSTEHVTKDGRVITCEWYATLLVNSRGENIGVACLGQDVTEQRLLLERLRKAKESAEAAAKAKSEFLSMMSHEIRTPMNGIIGLSSLLLESQLQDEPRQYAQGIRSSADSLLSVINDILDFSKVDAGKMDIERVPFDLQIAIEEVLDLAAVNAQAKELELALRYAPDTRRYYEGDVGRIRQVILNLVTNAVKFTHRGMVLVEVETVPVDVGRDEVRIAVHDTGVGIPADKFHLLFSQFTQLDSSSTRRYGGSGLGLAICDRLARLMHGEIQVVSESGEGATFTFRLPLPHAVRPTGAVRPSLAGIRLLLVDHHEVSRFSCAERCAGLGIEILEARSGEEAVKIFQQAMAKGIPVHAVMADHRLPDINVTRMAAMLRAATDEPVPIVLLATYDAHRPELSDSTDFAATLTKPIREQALAETLIRTLGIPQPQSKPRHPHNTLQFSGLSVLLVEDNAINQRVAAALLGKLGARVDIAGNGREALEMVARFPFDFILMDCQMPEMDGFEATRKIRNLPAPACKVPIIALTAGAMEADRQKCLECGMNDYLAKPVVPEALRGMLEAWTAKSGWPGLAADPAQDATVTSLRPHPALQSH
ncbi:MAG: PAS domain S-box protein [Bryobacterales bacterium]|nr:PAS domain S-box protein [Bryobacterales bacterium]